MVTSTLRAAAGARFTTRSAAWIASQSTTVELESQVSERLLALRQPVHDRELSDDGAVVDARTVPAAGAGLRADRERRVRARIWTSSDRHRSPVARGPLQPAGHEDRESEVADRRQARSCSRTRGHIDGDDCTARRHSKGWSRRRRPSARCDGPPETADGRSPETCNADLACAVRASAHR